MRLDEAFSELALVQVPVGNSNRPGSKLVPRFITIHNTDNDGHNANASMFLPGWFSTTTGPVSIAPAF